MGIVISTGTFLPCSSPGFQRGELSSARTASADNLLSGGEQDAGADQTPERHGLAWNTARSSPSLNSSSIGPSMS